MNYTIVGLIKMYKNIQKMLHLFWTCTGIFLVFIFWAIPLNNHVHSIYVYCVLQVIQRPFKIYMRMCDLYVGILGQFHKGLEHLHILSSVGALEPIPMDNKERLCFLFKYTQKH